ncbi:hypothetical protein GGI42DRAFT_330416 [Trichoderma sp. SZMC 28013]
MAKLTKVLATALALAGSSVATWPPNSKDCTTTATAADGFPTPNAQQLRAIEETADGTLSNAPPPATLADSTLQSLQVIAVNEEFEVAYFRSLLANVTTGVPGFESWKGYGKAELEKILKVIIAQEELHALNALNALNKFKKLAPLPCKYHFPATNIHDAIAVAEAFTAVVLGTLQDVTQGAAAAGDAGFTRGVASIIGQEGEQNGFYRTLLGAVPSEKPFLTTSVGPFAYSFLNNNFIVPNSCPFDVNSLGVPIFTQLNVEGGSAALAVKPDDQWLNYSADLSSVKNAAKFAKGKGDGLFITYFSGQLLPISVPVKDFKWNGGKVSFKAFFPFEENIMFGLSLAALTDGSNFTSPDAVPAATLAAPAIINVNDEI